MILCQEEPQNPIKRYSLHRIRNKDLFRKEKGQDNGLQNSSKISSKKGRHMMKMACFSRATYEECRYVFGISRGPRKHSILTRAEHFEAHNGNWKNPTNWYFNPVTKEKIDFGDGPFIPCKKFLYQNLW